MYKENYYLMYTIDERVKSQVKSKQNKITVCSSVRSERLFWEQEVAGSNPAMPIAL